MRKPNLLLSLFASILILTTSCSSKKDVNQYSTPDYILKNSKIFYPNRMESTPVVFKGRLYDVISDRMDSERMVEIFDSNTSQKITAVKLNIGLISALVVENELYIAGSTNWETPGPIKIYKSSDLINFYEIGTLNPAPGRRFFNSSLIFQNGKFIIAVEEDINGSSHFFPNFYESSDLSVWGKISELRFTNYIACPTLRYVDGEYYLFYLLTDHEKHVYYTSISKSPDLKNWLHSGKVVIAPGESEGQNNSDLDLVEFNSEVIINYAVGNQDSDKPLWVDLKKAKYEGSLERFVKSFFEDLSIKKFFFWIKRLFNFE